MKYRKDFKYQLYEDEVFYTHLRPGKDIFGEMEDGQTSRIRLNKAGVLTVMALYAWDGPSGPVIDRKTNMKPSLAHDALYELSRWGLIPFDEWRDYDKVFEVELGRSGAWSWVIWADLKGLEFAKGKAAHPDSKKKVYEDF